jgi:glycosyltransferase involved in cell wall biosynthesis
MSITVVSQSVPPDVTGQARALSLLTTDLNPRFVRNPQKGIWAGVTRFPAEVARVARGTSLLVGCSGNPFDLLAAAWAATWLRIPFVAHLFDDPVYQWPRGRVRMYASAAEALWSKMARTVIVPNEHMSRAFEKRRSASPVIVRNPVAGTPDKSELPWPAGPGRRRIVYTGSVYHAQADCLRALTAALDSMDDWSLDIYTPQTDSDLALMGIFGRHVCRRSPVSHEEALSVQRGADVLFLPLSILSDSPEVIETAAPMKLGEYLMSGRPILAHVPSSSFVGVHLSAKKAAIVVPTLGHSCLRSALSTIADNDGLRFEITQNARRLAAQYSAEAARDAYKRALALS